MAVRVVTYNLLVPVLAERPQYYAQCHPEHLQTKYRWKLIKSQLKQEIRSHKNTVICLQEVSRTLLPKLNSFFHRMEYTLYENLFGDWYDDYMGVAIAIPTTMPLISKHFIKIGSHLRSTIGSLEHDAKVSKWGHKVKNPVKGKSKAYSTDPWKAAIDTSNTLVCLGVRIDGRPLFIATYHMPCLYKKPNVMIIHCSIVKDLLFQLSAGHPFILAGDFNCRPYDIPYRVLTERGYGQSILLPTVGDYGITYRFNTDKPLRSAYREKNGAEPHYSNYCSTPKSANFCATLDYIFFDGNLTVDDVLQLPDYPIGKSYPDQTHPSDHLMLAASFRLF